MHFCIIYNYTDTKREKEIINNTWWIWAKDIWKYDVGSGICYYGSLAKEKTDCSGRYVHSSLCSFILFVSSCCDVLLLKDSLFFSSEYPYFPEITCFSRNLHMPVVEWWVDGLGGFFWGGGQGGGQLWLPVGSVTLVAEVLGSTHWCELCCRPPFDTKTWPHLSCVFIWLLYLALQIPPSGNSLRSEWMWCHL